VHCTSLNHVGLLFVFTVEMEGAGQCVKSLKIHGDIKMLSSHSNTQRAGMQSKLTLLFSIQSIR
jgi:hypothetical protein